jgi:HrpA-like RNA helicase
VKQKIICSRAGFTSLQIQPISQASAIQRMGRAGRACEGKCWRLYTENTYRFELPSNTLPEILRTNLSNVILLFHLILWINHLMIISSML